MTQWRTYRRVPAFVLPRQWHHWILDSGSLTKRLVALSGGEFKVDLLSLGWQRPQRDERRALGIPLGQRALIREVALRSRGEVVVKARSVIPVDTLKGKERQLKFLGEKPLGAFLFTSRCMQRSGIELGAMNWHDEHWIYGRRSVFLLHHKPLLVAELFMPALLEQASRDNRACSPRS